MSKVSILGLCELYRGLVGLLVNISQNSSLVSVYRVNYYKY